MFQNPKILSALLRYGGPGPFRRSPTILQMQWNYSTLSPKALSSHSHSPRFRSAPHKPAPAPVIDMNLITKRFLHNGSGDRESFSKISSLSSTLFTAFGVLVGLYTGARAAFDEFLFQESTTVSCAGKNKCCVERKCEDSSILHRLDDEERTISQAIGDFERALTDTKMKALDYTEAAMKAYCEAIDLMNQWMNSGYCVIDNDTLKGPCYEKAWCCVYKSARKRCAKVREALEKGQCAWELLCRLREVIEAGKECKYTSCHPLLPPAEEFWECAEKELVEMRSKFEEVGADHEMAAQYKSVIDDFKKELRPDVDCAIKEMKCCEIEIKFAEQEMAIMIDQAYKRVMRVQKELAHSQVCSDKVPKRAEKTCC